MIKVLNVISDLNVGGAGKCVINFCKNYFIYYFMLELKTIYKKFIHYISIFKLI
jgi:hypothetical protein